MIVPPALFPSTVSGRSLGFTTLKPRLTTAMANLLVLTLLFITSPLKALEPSGIAQAIQPFIERGEIAGAVALVTDRDNTIYIQSFGQANLAAKRPMAPEALFWIASMSKPITAIAVMMLVDEGKIKLDDPVERYLPGFTAKIVQVDDGGKKVALHAPATPITLRHLLSHTSGLPFSSAIENPVLDTFPLSVRTDSYALTSLQSEPGTRYLYSNAGINTAGRVVEAVSGMPFENFLKQRLFDPLGMNDTTFFPDNTQLARLAASYRFNDQDRSLIEIPLERLHNPGFIITRRHAIPAGGLFSTANDMGRLARMLLNEGSLEGKRYLSPAAMREMTHNQLPESIRQAPEWAKGRGYGFGLFTSPDNAFGHGGAYATDMFVEPNKGLATVWMVQIAGGPGGGSSAAFKKAVFGKN
jgi:CubicO group peptidase (beta-lactamase class C family)